MYCIYIPHISLIAPWRFTILPLGEIGRQLVKQPRSQGLVPILSAGREKALASAGHVST